MSKKYTELIKGISEVVDRDDYTIWLRDLQIEEISERQIRLSTTSPYKLTRIERDFTGTLRDYFSATIHGDRELVFSTRSSSGGDTADSTSSDAVPQAAAESRPVHGLKDHLDFRRYLVGRHNRIPYEISQKVVSGIGKHSPLYVYGSVGTGKTHLMQAIGNYFAGNHPYLQVRYVTPNDFVSEFTRAISSKSDRQFRLKYRTLDVLLLDDIQFFIGKEKSSVEFFHIFNEIYAPDKQLIFCSDRVPDELDDLDERLKSRLCSSIVVELQEPDQADREELLRFYCSQHNLELTSEVVSFLAEHIAGDIRRIIGAVNTLVSYQDILGEQIDISFCRDKLRQLIRTRPENYSAERIMLSIANYSRISLADLKSARRTRSISHYRQILMYMLKQYTRLSFPEIGAYLGGKTQAAAHSAYKHIQEQLGTDPLLVQVIDKVLQGC